MTGDLEGLIDARLMDNMPDIMRKARLSPAVMAALRLAYGRGYMDCYTEGRAGKPGALLREYGRLTAAALKVNSED